MPLFGDHPLMVRMSLALVLANARYWSTVASLVRSQLDYWTLRAERIPDPTLQEVALVNLREEGFNAQATATLATLAPREYRKLVVEAIVGLQVIYDYLDSLVERPLEDPLGDGRRLYQAFVDAIALDSEPRGDYYAQIHESDDGGYLGELVGVVRAALIRLPSQAAIAEVSAQAAERCAEAQIHAHATPVLGSAQLELWATSNAVDTGLQWREFLAGAVSSGLALHALITTAADSRTSQGQALAVDEIYLSVCALTTLLDGLIDYEQDMRGQGQPGYIRYYEDHDALAQGLRSVMHHAATEARDIPNEAHHLMTLVGVVAYYASAPTASSGFARPITKQIHRELKPLIVPTLAIMRAWRAAKRARAVILYRSRPRTVHAFWRDLLGSSDTCWSAAKPPCDHSRRRMDLAA
jgi:tetraprenyl-beta-curcumene synthase